MRAQQSSKVRKRENKDSRASSLAIEKKSTRAIRRRIYARAFRFGRNVRFVGASCRITAIPPAARARLMQYFNKTYQ